MIRGFIYGLCLAVLWAGGASACAGDSGELVGFAYDATDEAGDYEIEWAPKPFEYGTLVLLNCFTTTEFTWHQEAPTIVQVEIEGHVVYRMTREELALACKVLKMEREGGE